MQKNIIFNPINNKFPKSSVSDKEQTRLEVLIKDDFYFNELKVIVFDDYGNKIIVENFKKVAKENHHYHKYQVNLPVLNQGLYFYYFEIVFDAFTAYIKQDKLNAAISKDYDQYPMWQLSVHSHNFTTPEWFKGGIMYQIFPDRFKKSQHFTIKEEAKNQKDRFIHDNWTNTPHSSITHKNYRAKDFFMGNLEGIREEKSYFQNLHINSIYLNPIVESAENHRYSTADYFKVDPYFATNEDFENFCKEFKNDDIKIILDGVFSHTGSDSIYFNKDGHYNSLGAYNSNQSPYYDWFTFFNFPNSYHSWWGFENLPTVNKLNDDFLNFITQKDSGVVNYWQKLGIAGWRLDVADEFPDKFLDEIRSSAKSYDKDAIIIGEVWEDASNKMAYNQRRRYFQGAQLDSVMNYPWRDAIINFVKTEDAKEFEYQINKLIEHYPTQALDALMNLLSSHDIPRLLTSLAVDDAKNYPLEQRPNYKLTKETYDNVKALSKFAAFIQFTLPGVPSIYYGDEIGMYGFTDPYNRLGFDRENIDYDLLTFYKELTAFRKENKKDFVTGFNFIKADKGLIIYQRNTIICIINTNDSPQLETSMTKGNFVFGNKAPIFTTYGLVIPNNAYIAIKI